MEKGRAGDQGSGRGHSLFAAFSQFDLLYGQSGSSRILKFPSEFLHHHQVLLGLKGMRPEASFFVVVCFVILFLFLFFFSDTAREGGYKRAISSEVPVGRQ